MGGKEVFRWVSLPSRGSSSPSTATYGMGRVLSDDELAALRQRSEDIVEGRLDHMPARYVQREKQFRDGGNTEVPVLDRTRKMTHLAYFDDLFASMARKPEIVDVIADLLGPNIKLYHDQLMMKPPLSWHGDRLAPGLTGVALAHPAKWR